MSCQDVLNQNNDSQHHLGSLTSTPKSSQTNAHHSYHHVPGRPSSHRALSFENPNSQQACNSSELLGAILHRDEMRDSRLCQENSLAIRSVTEGSTFPLVLVIYCVVEMLRKAITVTTASLFDACEELERLITPMEMNLLKEIEIPERLRIALRNLGGSNHRENSSRSNHDRWEEERSRQNVDVRSNGIENSQLYSVFVNQTTTQSQTGGWDSRVANLSTTQQELKAAQFGSTFSSPLPVNDNESQMAKEWLRNECLVAVTNEHYILEKLKICLQCCENPRDITFLPCGHFTTCRACAGATSVCGLCNKRILATIDTYLS